MGSIYLLFFSFDLLYRDPWSRPEPFSYAAGWVPGSFSGPLVIMVTTGACELEEVGLSRLGTTRKIDAGWSWSKDWTAPNWCCRAVPKILQADNSASINPHNALPHMPLISA